MNTIQSNISLIQQSYITCERQVRAVRLWLCSKALAIIGGGSASPTITPFGLKGFRSGLRWSKTILFIWVCSECCVNAGQRPAFTQHSERSLYTAAIYIDLQIDFQSPIYTVIGSVSSFDGDGLASKTLFVRSLRDPSI